MTRLTEKEELGAFGYDYVRTVIETGWRARLQKMEGLNDRGLDGTVIDFHRNTATGLRFDIQVKTSKTRFRADTFDAGLDKVHLDLYRRATRPVVVICVDANPPVTAFWRLITSREGEGIGMSRQEVFGPASRGEVIAAIQEAHPQTIELVPGEVLEFPLQKGIREAAKRYYVEELMPTPEANAAFGPVHFTWKGWHHITRRHRSRAKIPASLMLLGGVNP